ncbi:FMN-binding protein [Vagococcus lutrae]|uniref:FMN-binding protein n=1 Tax=Vagococcus lutrae TaxID=81947 RepID=A0AAE9XJ40_9ENTE|nr:extracellular electron transfer flavoprotein PplA [Vagococcus lutrae]MDT2802261.1 FMN-binding protein [Vagococcus lutrae]MDY3705147.1 extracellular electron transfer flavoprotein PplA [Vagococcus lutrae]QZN88120.1 FMN-binding protein [Vagococcus lutrae]UQF37930.1 FMN-binding protein [Vagococcus lutrae]WCG23055.1 FMN-binding protein [Vagococcus lutrae]
MKKKKLISGLAILAMSSLLLVACKSDDQKEAEKTDATQETVAKDKEESKEEAKEMTQVAGGELKDGTYTLEEKNYSNDYRTVFSIVVKDGKITESNYDNVNEAGESKVENKEYDDMMKDKSGTGPSEFIPALNEALVDKQNAGDVEVVTGATHSTDSFKNYAQQLIQAAQAGNTDKIEIDNGADLKDGTYTLEEKNYSNDYRVVFSIVVKDGKIAESNYDNVNEAGESKADNKEYDDMMKDKAGTGPSEFIPAFNKGLVDKGAPAEMDAVTGATHSFHTFQMYAEQLINAAEKGNTDKIEVDNIVMAEK